MRKVVHIIPTLQSGGAENVLIRLVEEFKKKGIEQTIITLIGSDKDFLYNKAKSFCKVINIKNNSKIINKELKNEGVIIIAWMYRSILYIHLKQLFLSFKHPIYWNIRHSDFGWFQLIQKVSVFIIGLFSRILKPKIIYCSNKSLKVHTSYFFSIKRARVIQNGLAKKFSKKVSSNNLYDFPYLLFVGRFHPQKGPKYLRKIVIDLFKRNSDYKLIVLGDGWKIDFFPIEIRDKIILLGVKKEIDYLYKNANCLLFTSKFGEGYPNVLVEASYFGTPIVGFNAGDSKEILDEYEYGFEVSKTNHFVNKVEEIIISKKNNKEKKAVIEKQIERLSFSKTVEKYIAFLFS